MTNCIWQPVIIVMKIELEQAFYDSPEAYERLMDVLDSEEPVLRKPTDPIWITGLIAGFDQNYSGLAAPFACGGSAVWCNYFGSQHPRPVRARSPGNDHHLCELRRGSD